MGETFFQPLSHLDASFLALESPTTHMHVAAVAIFEANALSDGKGGIDLDRIRAHIEGKLQYIPRYRQRLAYVPVTRAPVWIDDQQFDLDFHLRYVRLPHPGSDDQLRRMAGRIVSQKLDRSRPMWELWLVEGLARDRFAVIAKIHHCMIDGVAGVDLTTILLNVVPTSDIEPAAPWEPRPAPTGTDLAVTSAARTTRRIFDLMTSWREISTRGSEIAAAMAGRAQAAFESLGSGWLTSASRTPLNPDLGLNRRFDGVELSLDRVKTVRRKTGGSINDLVLTIATGAIRRYLLERGFKLKGVEFRAMVPVSTRSAAEPGSMGNQVAMWLVNLPVSEPDPLTRLDTIRKETTRLKDDNHALGAATLVDLSRGTPIPLIYFANRVVGPKMRPFNITITNVPGPQFPMYLLEARMLSNYPMVPLWSQHGLSLALFSYDGKLLWGILADYDAIPDTGRVTHAIEEAFSELEAAVAPDEQGSPVG
jgi:WS/DGAT/MGAT family acyltransferase